MTWIFTGASTATILGSTAAAGGTAALGAGTAAGLGAAGAAGAGGLAAAEGAGAAVPAVASAAPAAAEGAALAAPEVAGAAVPEAAQVSPALASSRLSDLMNTAPPPVDQPKPGPGGLPGPESIGLPDPGGPQPGAMPKLSDAMGPLEGLMDSGPNMPQAELPPRPTMQAPADWQSQMKGAHQALRLASKMIPNSQAQDTLNLMAATTGAGSNVSDPTEAMKMVQGPVSDLAANAQKKQQQEQMRLQKAMPLPGTPPPMPAQTQMTPAAATSYMPPTTALTPEQRMRLARGY